MSERETLCDQCDNCEFKGVVVWGREPNEAEQKLNDTLEKEGKAYFCSERGRYFNKSFPKRKHHCEFIDTEIDALELESMLKEDASFGKNETVTKP